MVGILLEFPYYAAVCIYTPTREILTRILVKNSRSVTCVSNNSQCNCRDEIEMKK